MKTSRFNIGQTYTKGNNQYMFRGMFKNEYHFWIRNNDNEAWQNITISKKMTDILDNLK
jgi:hypothetical protein